MLARHGDSGTHSPRDPTAETEKCATEEAERCRRQRARLVLRRHIPASPPAPIPRKSPLVLAEPGDLFRCVVGHITPLSLRITHACIYTMCRTAVHEAFQNGAASRPDQRAARTQKQPGTYKAEDALCDTPGNFRGIARPSLERPMRWKRESRDRSRGRIPIPLTERTVHYYLERLRAR